MLNPDSVVILMTYIGLKICMMHGLFLDRWMELKSALMLENLGYVSGMSQHKKIIL